MVKQESLKEKGIGEARQGFDYCSMLGVGLCFRFFLFFLANEPSQRNLINNIRGTVIWAVTTKLAHVVAYKLLCY